MRVEGQTWFLFGRPLTKKLNDQEVYAPPDLPLLISSHFSLRFFVNLAAQGEVMGSLLRNLNTCRLKLSGFSGNWHSPWEAAGRAPHCLNHSRMVNFGKPGKVRAEGVLLVDHCRPITVMSAFWRAWSSAWLQTPTAPLWLQTLPDVVVTGKQSEAALTAAALFTKLNKLQYGASLDFSKCYDLMRPEGTARLLTTGGCPQGITNLLLSVWTSQLLWICWDSHTGEVPLRAGACVPQGCPFGPLALALWVTAGHNAVTAQDNQLFSGICRPYVHCS